MQNQVFQGASGQSIQVLFEASGDKLAVWHHGTPNPRELSSEVLAVFARHGYSVVCPIRPGYGETTLTRTDGQNMSEMAPVTAAVVAHLGFDKFVSFGHSSGGARALSQPAGRLAAARDQLVLICRLLNFQLMIYLLLLWCIFTRFDRGDLTL